MSLFRKQPSTCVLRKRCSENMYYLLLKSHFGMGVLLWICCILSERLFPRTHLGGCFYCLLKIRLLVHENWKSYKCRQKKYLDFVLASLQGCITVDSYTSAEFFYFFKCIINTNSWKLKRSPIGEMSDSNSTWILECYKFENCFQYQMRYFFSKKVDLFKLWDLQVFN